MILRDEGERNFCLRVMSAREHYTILKLAIYKTKGKWIDSSADVMNYIKLHEPEELERIWQYACAVANALGYYKEEK